MYFENIWKIKIVESATYIHQCYSGMFTDKDA
jgi:hypothetical protein